MSNKVNVHIRQIGPSASEGRAREHVVVMDRPVEKGGENRGAMGGEHLLMSLGGCFMSNFLAAARSRETDLSDVKMTITGTLDGSPPRFTAVEMRISVNGDDRGLVEKLITIAERSCIVANTMKAAVDLSIRVVD